MFSRRHQPVLPHFCNEPLRCPCCTHRFWIWAENYSWRFERVRVRGKTPVRVSEQAPAPKVQR